MIERAMSATGNRSITLQDVHNFRDYGGYATPEGMLRRGWLYRSAQHSDATDRDLDFIAGIGFGLVVDLRGPGERASAPCRRPAGFAAVEAFVEEETVRFAPHVAAARTALTPTAARAALTKTYAALVTGRRMRTILARYFALLAETDAPSLVCCMAGKDRTGLAVALLHLLMGVHKDDIFADYLLTNEVEGQAARIAAGTAAMRAAFGVDIDGDTLAELMAVRPDYLASAFAAIDEEFGGAGRYFSEILDISSERRTAIAARLLC